MLIESRPRPDCETLTSPTLALSTLPTDSATENMEGFVREAAPDWREHRLSGGRRNEWSVSVSANWRITFEERGGGIERLNLEDYH